MRRREPYPWGLQPDGRTIHIELREDLDHLDSRGPVDAIRVCLVDVETTGLDPTCDRVIELATLTVRCDPATGTLYRGGCLEDGDWLQDPGTPIPAEVTAITGLTDDDVRGQKIPPHALDPVRDADVVVSHNAAFDWRFVSKQWPSVHGKIWGCSYRQLDWLGYGYPVAKLGVLCRYHGFWFRAHRAGADCIALARLLSLRPEAKGPTYARELLDTISTPSYLISARWASFEMREGLRRLRYRWHPEHKVWQLLCTEPDLPDRLLELEALYSKWRCRPAPGPLHVQIPAAELWAYVS
jgi:DNA polymerase-3 subunit epsilon